ncbi:MAG: hypothetical protein ACR2G4_10315 [Pyrinomonadaceae bacterium]
MMKQETQKGPERPQPAATATKRRRPLAGLLIAGASLALLFGVAALKGRVKDDTN